MESRPLGQCRDLPTQSPLSQLDSLPSPGVQGSDGDIFLVGKWQLLIDCCAGREGGGRHSRDLETNSIRTLITKAGDS